MSTLHDPEWDSGYRGSLIIKQRLSKKLLYFWLVWKERKSISRWHNTEVQLGPLLCWTQLTLQEKTVRQSISYSRLQEKSIGSSGVTTVYRGSSLGMKLWNSLDAPVPNTSRAFLFMSANLPLVSLRRNFQYDGRKFWTSITAAWKQIAVEME